MPPRIMSFLTVAVVVANMNTEAQAQNLISNGLFDTNIDGWTLSGGGPESTIIWDATNGSPAPGSLRLSSTLVPNQSMIIEAFSECLNNIPAGFFGVSGMVLKPAPQFGLRCYATFVLYEGSDCTGSRTFTGNTPANTPGVWESSGLEGEFPVVLPSARASLTMVLNGAGAGEKACLFDTVLVGDTRGIPVTDIPTLSWTGLLVLILVVALAAMALIGSRFRRRFD